MHSYMRPLLDLFGLWALVLLVYVAYRQGLDGLRLLGRMTLNAARDLALPAAIVLAAALLAHQFLGWP
jgi:hypothetical protein